MVIEMTCYLAIWNLYPLVPVFETKKETTKVTIQYITNDFLLYNVASDGDSGEEWNMLTFTHNVGAPTLHGQFMTTIPLSFYSE